MLNRFPMNRTERRKLERALKREQKKEKRAERRQQEQDRKEKELKEYQQASEVNRSLKFAGTILNAEENYAKFLYPLMSIIGKSNITPGASNEYFKINPEWNGKLQTLFKNVTFLKIPLISNILGYVKKIKDEPHSSPLQYKEFQENWHHKSYLTNTRGLNIPKNVVSKLEEIMNSSYAWHIAQRGAQDSEQTKSNWIELYNTVKYANDNNVLDNLISMIENEDDLNQIKNFVDNAIRTALKE